MLKKKGRNDESWFGQVESTPSDWLLADSGYT